MTNQVPLSVQQESARQSEKYAKKRAALTPVQRQLADANADWLAGIISLSELRLRKARLKG